MTTRSPRRTPAVLTISGPARMIRPGARMAALSLAGMLVLAGCSDTGATGNGMPGMDHGNGSSSAPAANANEADIMFATMMIPHHEQAVDMSEILLAKDDVPADVRAFAQKVVDAQGPEIERMNQMLRTWEAPMPGEDSTSMGHGAGGMMSEEDMGMLNDAQGTDAARLYLEQMTVHHEGAVEMAQTQLVDGENPQALELAQQIIDDQQAEISDMEGMLASL